MTDDTDKKLTELIQEIRGLARAVTIASKNVLRADEVADFLGITEGRIYVLCAARELPHYKRGQRSFFRKDELEQWMTQRRVRTDEEAEREAEALIAARRRTTTRSRQAKA